MNSHTDSPRPALPRHLFSADRQNSRGVDISDPAAVQEIADQLAARRNESYEATPLLGGAVRSAGAAKVREIRSPANTADVVGIARDATAEEMDRAFETA